MRFGVGSYNDGFIAGYRDVITRLRTTHDLPSSRWLRGYDDGRAQAELDLNPFGVKLRDDEREKEPEHEQEVRDRIAYSIDHGTSPQSEALRVLRKFMCCQAGREMVEYGLARPFGHTLAPLDRETVGKKRSVQL